jgi:hypothetical protein
MSKTILKTALIGATAAVAIGAGVITTSAPASAQIVVSGPVYRGGGGFVGGYRGGYVAAPRYYGGGYRTIGYRNHGYGYGYRPRYRNNGGALAAGLIGGLALGAIASNSYNYGYGYAPSYGYGYAPVTYGYGGCTIERRVRINRFGERVIRDVEICR